MSKIHPSEEVMNGKQENQESETSAVLSHDDRQNEESIIPEPAKDKGKHPFLKVEDKGKRPMSESYELEPLKKPTFSNLERGTTSENELKEADEYDYDLDLAILKSIYHYYFNHGIIPYPYSEYFINYVEASIPNLKFSGNALVTKIFMLEDQFLTVMEMAAAAGRYPDIIHPVFPEIFFLSMGLWGNPRDYYPVHNVDVITRNEGQENRIQEKLQAVKKGKRPMSELYEFKHVVPTFSNPGVGAGTSENELQENDYDYHQDLAILKSIYQYYFNHGGKIPYPISKELINYIEALVPNLKVRGQELATKIIMLEKNFLAFATVGFDPDQIHPVCLEIFYLSMGLWG